METIKIISEELLDAVSQQAKESHRLRMNYNIHNSLDDKVHRLLNALEPGSYLTPHRHTNPDKDETYIILRGSLVVVFYDDEGNIVHKTELNNTKGVYGIDIPAGTWHNIIILESNTVIFEIKEGPYIPLSADNVPSWAPDASDEEAVKKFMDKIQG